MPGGVVLELTDHSPAIAVCPRSGAVGTRNWVVWADRRTSEPPITVLREDPKWQNEQNRTHENRLSYAHSDALAPLEARV